jgi:hypothetical protein
VEAVKIMSSYDCLKESMRWGEISDEYLMKQMYYVGRNDMTEEDQVKFKEYSALGKMALDSAKFYQDKFHEIRREAELRAKYDSLTKVK